jgi:hypothetical protein
MADRREGARRYVRRKRTFYMVVVVYLVLVVLWFLIDVLTGADDWWFHWPTPRLWGHRGDHRDFHVRPQRTVRRELGTAADGQVPPAARRAAQR